MARPNTVGFGPKTAEQLYALVSKTRTSKVNFQDLPQQETSDNGLKWVQAPVGGIPAATGASPSTAKTCDILIRATTNGTGYVIGDLIKTGATVDVVNYYLDVAASEGDRRCRVSSHTTGSEVEGWSCTNDNDPADIKTRINALNNAPFAPAFAATFGSG